MKDECTHGGMGEPDTSLGPGKDSEQMLTLAHLSWHAPIFMDFVIQWRKQLGQLHRLFGCLEDKPLGVRSSQMKP